MIRTAEPHEDAALRELAGQPMGGAISLSMTAEPSLFASLPVHGHDPRVVVAEQGGRLVAMGVIAKRRVFVNGAPAEIGYLGGLRIEPSSRNGMVLARGYERFARMHSQGLRVPFYLTSIMDDNRAALGTLTSGRAGLPVYSEIGPYHTVLTPARRLPKAKRAGQGDTALGPEIGWARILRFLNEWGSRKQFFPVCEESDFGGGAGLYRGLHLSDFLAVKRGQELLGVLGLWDQRPFRQVCVARYSPSMDLVRRAADVLLPACLIPKFPAPGTPIDLLYAASVVVRDNDPEIFSRLFGEAIHQAWARGAALVAMGLFPEDPLAKVLSSQPRWTIRSRIFSVRWPGGDAAAPTLDGRLKYIELGSL